MPDAHAEPHAADTTEQVRELRAEVERLRGEVALRDAALARLGERLVPVERARAAGAVDERERMRAVEDELRELHATKIYRYLLRPRAALYRFRARRGAPE